MSSSRNKIAELLAHNAEYAKSFPGAPKAEVFRQLGKAKDSLPISVRKYTSLAITPLTRRHLQTSDPVTCVDPRCVPESFFGPGLRGAVYQNAGGRATDDVFRSLNILRALMNLKVVLVVHHTGTKTLDSSWWLFYIQ
jgi:carbonic anhydrase